MEAAPAYRGDLRTSWPDRWGHGRCTAAIARPHVDAGLWPVSHTELMKLNLD
jgi:hypothetical protein